MLRRDFVRAVVSVSFSPGVLLCQQTGNPAAPPPPAPVPWTLGLNPHTPLPQTQVVDEIAETGRHFFSPQQMETLERLCDVLLPRVGNKPGALQAGTPLFLDFLVGSSLYIRKKMYTDGLGWLDSEAQKRYRMSFAKLNDMQTDAILKPWLRTWMSDHPPTEQHADFINVAHDDIRTATVNSKMWSDVPSVGAQESTSVGLYWWPIQPDMNERNLDCTRLPAHVMAAPNSSHPMPTYPR